MLAALAQSCRLSAFRLLVEAGESGCSAGDIAERCAVPASTLSFHLKALAHAGLVHADSQGRHVIYRAELAAIRDLVDFLTHQCCGGASCVLSPAEAAAPPRLNAKMRLRA